MNTIFEIDSARVKGISFHPIYPWVVTSLHNGSILLYDYIHKMLIEEFSEHDGPVRSVAFHNTQPFFVSGGDDTTIKVWNYTTKKCQFTLTGHKDYVRTVQFHHELPWILSSSDDMTIRVWNWLNRTLLTTASGHDHYVMTAFFHPTQDWIVSSSLDSTIRIWDYSVLRKKFFEARSNTFEVLGLDITMIHKLEGHERGVNWAIFHPNLNLIASASDDKVIKIWKYSNSSWNEADSLRGHMNNVSAVIFHPKFDFVISNSEDKSIRIWDLNKKNSVEKLVKENDRFWILASHPSISLFAAGSDSGLIVFKLENTRIPSTSILNNILLYSNKTMRLWKNGSTEKKQICNIKHEQKGIKHGIVAVIKNPFLTDVNQYINFCLLINDNGTRKANHCFLKYDGSKYTIEENYIDGCNSVCFLSKNRYLTLQQTGLISFETTNINNKFPVDTGTVSIDNIDSIFQGPHGKFILKFKNGIIGLFDVNTKKVTHEITELTNMKYAIWNHSMTYCALVGENNIFLTNKQMEVLTKIKEKSSIKSVCFDENIVLFYSTYFHVKYTLIEPGLNGIVKSTENPLYLMSVANSVLYYSTANQSIESLNINYSDIRFKLDLFNKNYDNIVSSLNHGTVFGLKAVENIQNAGFPDLSLKFVKDPKQKFSLALKSGKLEEAKEAADQLKENVYYEKLAEKAMMMGKLDIAEFCYVKSYNLDKLIFFYTISGRQDKLAKIAVALKNTDDNSRRFLNSIYTSNVDEKIQVLKTTGHNTLALLMSKLNDRDDEITELNEKVKSEGKEIAFNENDYKEIKSNMKPIVPLKPVVGIKHKEYHSNWLSLTEIKKASQQSSIDNILNQKEDEMQDGEGAIFNQISMDDSSSQSQAAASKEKAKEKENAQKKKLDKWKDEDEDEDSEEIQKMLAEAQKNEKAKATTLTQQDSDLLHRKASKSLLPGVQLALGNYKLALSYLKSQLGITDYSKLKSTIKDIYMSSYTQVKIMPYLPSIDLNLRNPKSKNLNTLIPQNGVTLTKLNRLLSQGYDLISDFEMGEAMKIFRDIIKYSIFFIATDSEEESKVKSIISICREYIYLTKLSLMADSFKDKDKVKYCNIVCLMSLCQLELSEHKFLIYKKAKYCCKNIKNFITAIHFVKKILSLEKELYSEFEKEINKSKEELDLFQKIGTNQNQLEFEPNEQIEISKFYSSIKLEKVNLNDDLINCPLCSSIERKKQKGDICGTCDLCVLGESVIGLKLIDSK